MDYDFLLMLISSARKEVREITTNQINMTIEQIDTQKLLYILNLMDQEVNAMKKLHTDGTHTFDIREEK